jgi:hypothetical protein
VGVKDKKTTKKRKLYPTACTGAPDMFCPACVVLISPWLFRTGVVKKLKIDQKYTVTPDLREVLRGGHIRWPLFGPASSHTQGVSTIATNFVIFVWTILRKKKCTIKQNP